MLCRPPFLGGHVKAARACLTQAQHLSFSKVVGTDSLSGVLSHEETYRWTRSPICLSSRFGKVRGAIREVLSPFLFPFPPLLPLISRRDPSVPLLRPQQQRKRGCIEVPAEHV